MNIVLAMTKYQAGICLCVITLATLILGVLCAILAAVGFSEVIGNKIGIDPPRVIEDALWCLAGFVLFWAIGITCWIVNANMF